MNEATSPEQLGLIPERWNNAVRLVHELCAEGVLPSAAIMVGRGGETTGPYYFGRQTLSDDAPLRDDAIFLIASITKPVVAMGFLLLVERGLVALGDRVGDFLPEFPSNHKNGVTIRHLLTHTSGLPDMLPNNRELREDNAPLTEFVKHVCEGGLDFPPGRGVQYQSMGFAILGELIERISGVPCPEFLRREFFEPLEMNDTELGTPDSWYEGDYPQVNRIAEIRVPENQKDATSWNWNSRYWRSLGSPWGGLLTTPSDLGKFAQLMLDQGLCEEGQLLAPATVEAATRNQLNQMRDVPEVDRRCRPWGLGWRLHWPAHSANFGDMLAPSTFGHWGATGTVLWIDPELDAFALVLTTQPQEPHGSYLARICNVIAASFA